MKDHSLIEELVASQALGGLDESDARTLAAERAAHGEACPECKVLEAAYGEVAGRLAFALDPAPVSEPLRARVMSSALRPERRAGRAPRAVAAVAAAAALLLGGGIGGYLLSPREALEGGRVTQFEAHAAGTLAFISKPGTSDVYLVGTHVPAPPSGKVYQLWTIAGETPAPGPTFAPRNGSVLEHVRVDLAGSELMAVTIEPEGGSTQPTTEPIFTAPVAA